MEPVDPDEAPDYYKVITDPMGNLFLQNFVCLFVLFCFFFIKKMKLYNIKYYIFH